MESLTEALLASLAQHGLPGLVAALCLAALVITQRQYQAAQAETQRLYREAQMRYIEHLERAETAQREDSEYNREAMRAIVDAVKQHDGEVRVRDEHAAGRINLIEREIQTIARQTNDAAQAAAAAAACAKEAADTGKELTRRVSALEQRIRA